MTYDTVEFYENLLSHFYVHSDGAFLASTLREDVMWVCLRAISQQTRYLLLFIGVKNVSEISWTVYLP